MVIMLVQMHIYLTHLIFNRPTVCIIAHKNLDFSASFEKKKSHQFSTGWPPMYPESPGAECEPTCANDAVASVLTFPPPFPSSV